MIRLLPYFDTIIGIIFATYLNEIMIRRFGPEQFAIYAVSLNYGSILALIMLSGLSFQIQRLLFKEDSKLNELLRSFNTNIILSLIFISSCYLLVTSKIVIFSALIALLLSWKGYLYGWELMRHQNILPFLANQILRGVIIILLILFPFNINIFLVMYAIFLTLVIFPVLFKGKYWVDPSFLRRPKMSRLNESVRLTFIPLLEFIQLRGDLIVISFFLGGQLLGDIVLAYTVYFAAMIFPLLVSKQSFQTLVLSSGIKVLISWQFIIYICCVLLFTLSIYFFDVSDIWDVVGLTNYKRAYQDFVFISWVMPIASLNYILRYYLQAKEYYKDLMMALIISSLTKMMWFATTGSLGGEVLLGLVIGELAILFFVSIRVMSGAIK